VCHFKRSVLLCIIILCLKVMKYLLHHVPQYKRLVVVIDLRVDDHGMMTNLKDLGGGLSSFSIYMCGCLCI